MRRGKEAGKKEKVTRHQKERCERQKLDLEGIGRDQKKKK
jgi:hypothetical protein